MGPEQTLITLQGDEPAVSLRRRVSDVDKFLSRDRFHESAVRLPSLFVLMAKKRAAAAVTRSDFDRIIASIEATVRAEGSLAPAAIVRAGIPKSQLAEAIAALEARGLESTKKSLRVPVADQITTLIADGAMRKPKDITAGVAGASKKEIDAATSALVKQGNAAWVVRTKEIVLVGVGAAAAPLLSAAEIDAVERAVDYLSKATKLARKKKATLLRSDVENVLPRFTPRAEHDPTSMPSIPELVDQHREKTGLTFVPTLVRALGGTHLIARAVHAALLQGARSGVFELRPESGLARLSAEDVAFCIPGPQGSRLSWVRRLDS